MAKMTKITQIGMTTANLEKKIANYEKVGVGPWEIVVDTQKGLGAPATNTKFRGVPTTNDVRVAICVLDGLEIELIQPMDENGTYAEHLRTHGEGYIHHLAIETDDNMSFRKIMKAEGCKSEWKGDVDPKLGQSFEYFDTRDLLGYYIELHDPEPVPDED
jgi:methylmalonyl-CoA/ethylmalonyl-CoA epimerase